MDTAYKILINGMFRMVVVPRDIPHLAKVKKKLKPEEYQEMIDFITLLVNSQV